MDTVLWYRAHTQIPEFRLCKPVYWALNRRAGLSADDVRRAQMRQFELERASAEVRTTSSAFRGRFGRADHRGADRGRERQRGYHCVSQRHVRTRCAPRLHAAPKHAQYARSARKRFTKLDSMTRLPIISSRRTRATASTPGPRSRFRLKGVRRVVFLQSEDPVVRHDPQHGCVDERVSARVTQLVAQLQFQADVAVLEPAHHEARHVHARVRVPYRKHGLWQRRRVAHVRGNRVQVIPRRVHHEGHERHPTRGQSLVRWAV